MKIDSVLMLTLAGILIAGGAIAAKKPRDQKMKEKGILLETHTMGGIGGIHHAFYVCWNGKVAVIEHGRPSKRFESRLTEAETSELVTAIEKGGFLLLQDSYKPKVQVDDGMRRGFIYRRGETVKSVVHSDGVKAPEAIDRLTQKLNELNRKYQSFNGGGKAVPKDGDLPENFCE